MRSREIVEKCAVRWRVLSQLLGSRGHIATVRASYRSLRPEGRAG